MKRISKFKNIHLKAYLKSLIESGENMDDMYAMNTLDLSSSECLAVFLSCSMLTKREQQKIMKVFFVGAENAIASHLTLASIHNKYKSIIFLKTLGSISAIAKVETILHEIGHYLKKHKNMYFDNITIEQDQLQEEEADEFARFILTKRLNKF
ncbi:MAG: hypothetical protein HQK49_19725 [Oligoflexia bacterium]|nr:hypothetical protein [Oligoflexia bacterium]